MAKYLKAAADPDTSLLAAAFKLTELPRVDASGSMRIGLVLHQGGRDMRAKRLQ
jgi:hypothetical protein